MGKTRTKGTKKVIEASMAVAIGVKLCEPAVIPMYPITPQTHIVERLADFINDGDLNAQMLHAESEHAAISATLGASATAVRTFTATASQGLALMHEVLHVVSGMRLPIVMAVANRALSAPINIWNDHQDSISARDTGWLQLYVESAQGALDTVIMAYKIAENQKVLLPVMVCLDGFTLSHVYEPVDIPSLIQVRRFLPKFKSLFSYLDPRRPLTLGPVGFPDTFMEFKLEQQNAIDHSRKVIKAVSREFRKSFGRSYGDGMLELYKMKDAKIAVACMGTICGTARAVVDDLRKKGRKAGLIKVKAFRPFPIKEFQAVTGRLDGLAVIDRDVSFGHKGALCTEIESALFSRKNLKIAGYIAGLGGRDVTPKHIESAFKSIGKSNETIWLR